MTCIILSGGSSRRAGGLNKAFLTIEGETFIERKIRQFTPLFEELVVVVREPEPYRHLPALIVADQVPGQGPLMGLYTGLKMSSSDVNFVTTVDSPFMNPELTASLVKHIGEYDVHIPRHGGFIEPLFAVYRKNCIPSIEKTLSERKVTSFFPYVRVKYAEEEMIRRFDPDLSSFININSIEEYQRIVKNSNDENIRKSHS